MRVYELARELGVPSRDVIALLEELSPTARTASSSVPREVLEHLRASGGRATEPQPVAAAVATPMEPEPVVVPDPVIVPEPQTPDPERPSRGTIRRTARRAKIVILWAVLGLGGGIVLSITLPYLFGYRSLTVLSGSMAPALNTGDVVVVREVSPLDVRIGDIVSFRDPEDAGRIITHRVRSIQVEDGTVRFVTKGDSNTGVEHWKIPFDGTVGRATYHVWRLGYALFWIRGRFGRLILVVIPALLLGAYELVRIWRPRPEEGLDEAVA